MSSLYTLPDGQNATMPEAQAAAIWAWWRGIAPLAIARGEGVEVCQEDDETWGVRTVYAPRWEGIRVLIDRTGRYEWLGEQSAPDVEPDLRIAPWQQGRICDMCRAPARVHRSELADGRVVTVAHLCPEHATEEERGRLDQAEAIWRERGGA